MKLCCVQPAGEARIATAWAYCSATLLRRRVGMGVAGHRGDAVRARCRLQMVRTFRVRGGPQPVTATCSLHMPDRACRARRTGPGYTVSSPVGLKLAAAQASGNCLNWSRAAAITGSCQAGLLHQCGQRRRRRRHAAGSGPRAGRAGGGRGPRPAQRWRAVRRRQGLAAATQGAGRRGYQAACNTGRTWRWIGRFQCGSGREGGQVELALESGAAGPVINTWPSSRQAMSSTPPSTSTRGLAPGQAAAVALTSAAQAPDPQARVNPAPRSHTRRRRRSGASTCGEPDVGAVREQRVAFQRRAAVGRWSRVVLEERGVRVAHGQRGGVAGQRQVQRVGGMRQRDVLPAEPGGPMST